jgi:hypothetical protein
MSEAEEETGVNGKQVKDEENFQIQDASDVISEVCYVMLRGNKHLSEEYNFNCSELY